MGNQRKTPADPASEREQLRQLTRELHEAAQDARAAARELTRAREGLAEAANEQIGAAVSAGLTEMSQEIKDTVANVAKSTGERVNFHVDHLERCTKIAIDAVAKIAEQTEARLMGYKSMEDAEKTVIKGIDEAVKEMAGDPGFIATVAEAVAESISGQVSFVTGTAAVTMRKRRATGS